MSNQTESILGKHILIGLTYLDAYGKVDKQVQLHGTITAVAGETLYFDRADGEGEFSVPFDGGLMTAEPDAIFTLKSTGEMVERVDFIASWTIRPPTRH